MSTVTTDLDIDTLEAKRKEINQRHDKALETAEALGKFAGIASGIGSVALGLIVLNTPSVFGSFTAWAQDSFGTFFLGVAALALISPAAVKAVVVKLVYPHLAPLTPPNYTPFVNEDERAKVQAIVTKKFEPPVRAEPVVQNKPVVAAATALDGLDDAKFAFWNMGAFPILDKERLTMPGWFANLIRAVYAADDSEKARKYNEKYSPTEEWRYENIWNDISIPTDSD